MAVELFKAAQSIFFKAGLMLGGGNITKGDKNSVAWVIVSSVKRLKLFEAKVRDICRVTAAIIVVSTGGIEMLTHGLP